MKNIVILLLLVIICNKTYGQTIKTIGTKSAYDSIVKNNVSNLLVDITKTMPSIQLDLRYNTKNNFTRTKLYKKATTTYLRKDAANALQKVQHQLQKSGLRLKIFDAYRPYAATVLMWDLIKDERYVANPKSGSNHNRGLAIDLTVIDVNGNELPMGTGFDNFTDTAHHSFTSLPAYIMHNRKLLKTTMEQYGFKALETEWWHFSYINSGTTAVYDLSFKLLKKIVK
jgi:zinc D-Ala-D-Ala dipeptidase